MRRKQFCQRYHNKQQEYFLHELCCGRVPVPPTDLSGVSSPRVSKSCCVTIPWMSFAFVGGIVGKGGTSALGHGCSSICAPGCQSRTNLLADERWRFMQGGRGHAAPTNESN